MTRAEAPNLGAPVPRNGRKGAFLKALRRLHAWVGLSGSALGLLFGITGFLMGHRAVMRIDTGQAESRSVQVELAQPPASIDALAQDLAARYGYPASRVRTRVQAPRPARFGGAQVVNAEQWSIVLTGHARFIRASYTPGNRVVQLEQTRTGLIGALERMHRSEAGDAPWILLADAFAGALVFLTLSGILLWTRLDGPKLLAAGLAVGGLAATVLIAARAW
ncbi:MAG TPA: PepSY-associated TM helix domain-containing protein [Holophagaceae bacterium]|nr:PepSY-associated TM helix domain-containing protein [Holophagaceae bacterium]